MYLHFVYICFQENESDYFWNFKMICKSFEVLETKCLCHPVPKMFFRKVVFLLTKVFHEDTIQSYLLFLSSRTTQYYFCFTGFDYLCVITTLSDSW